MVSDDEKRKLKQVFDKLAKGGESISVDEGLILIKSISEDFSVAEEDLYEMLGDGEDSEEVMSSRRISEEQLLRLVEAVKRKQNLANEADTVLAYVAMGGQQDRGGYVDSQKLIDIIKKEFEMTIDIERLI